MSASGQQATWRRVALALEPVELEAAQRVDVAQLVDDEHPAARADDARELGHDELRPRGVVEHPQAAGEVERPVPERQRGDVPLDERAVGRRLLACRREQPDVQVDARHGLHVRRDREGERPGAAPGVEHVLVALERGEDALDRVGERGGALLLQPDTQRNPVLAHPTTRLSDRVADVRTPHASSYAIVPATRACRSSVMPSPTRVTAAPGSTRAVRARRRSCPSRRCRPRDARPHRPAPSSR